MKLVGYFVLIGGLVLGLWKTGVLEHVSLTTTGQP